MTDSTRRGCRRQMEGRQPVRTSTILVIRGAEQSTAQPGGNDIDMENRHVNVSIMSPQGRRIGRGWRWAGYYGEGQRRHFPAADIESIITGPAPKARSDGKYVFHC
jgi:hypothetical protein